MLKTLEEIKALKARWDACTNDEQALRLAAETKAIQVTLDNDNTTCAIIADGEVDYGVNEDELSDICYLGGLDDDLGNRGGVETLLNILGIPFEHC